MIKTIGIVIIFLFMLLSSSFAEERHFEIKANRFSYTPNVVRVNRGDKVYLRLLSEDVTHGLYLDGYRLETTANPGREGNISFLANRTGRFTFRCSATCGEFHPFMVGYLIVEPNIRLYLFSVIALIMGVGSISALFLSPIFSRRKNHEQR